MKFSFDNADKASDETADFAVECSGEFPTLKQNKASEFEACGDSRLRGLRSRKPIGFRQWVVHQFPFIWCVDWKVTSAVPICLCRLTWGTDKVEQMIDGYTGFLFLDKKGKPVKAYYVEKKFQHAVAKYNKIYKEELPKTTSHVARHIYCTNMAKRGISVKTLQYLMGHSEIGVRMNVYTHLKLEDAKDEMERLKVKEEIKREMKQAEAAEAKKELSKLK